VSNMKHDHFAKCTGLSSTSRAEFVSLRASCGRRGSSANASKGMANSTAQYYHDSALRMGLIDTDEGIRFKKQDGNDHHPRVDVVETKRPAKPSHEVIAETPAPNSPLLASDGISALVIAASDPRSNGDVSPNDESDPQKKAIV